jgi:serine/threonine-protein kinase
VETRDPLVGAVVNGKYRVLGVVAQGGMGKIYRAVQIPLDRPVALKVLNSQYTSSTHDSAFQKRFFLEASALSRLQQPNIVTIYDYGAIDGITPESYFMAMEFLEGDTLLHRLQALGTLTAQETFSIARQIARGLREAHRHGVVHRDLKPSNIMLVPQDDGGELVKILDFGLVKVLKDDADQVTKEGTFLGSPRYMSPEQISHGNVDHRTDVYSLGVIMYQALCGLPPFESDRAVHTLMAHMSAPVPPMNERNPEVTVHPAAEAFVRRCLEKTPDLRPANMDELTRELTQCEVACGVAASALPYESETGSMDRPRAAVLVGSELPTGPPPALVPAGSRRLWPFALGAVAVVALAGAYFALRARAPAPPPAPDASAAHDRSPGKASFTMWIDSAPSGAEVFDGDQQVGTTPLQISVDNAAVRAQPKRLAVRLGGYQAYSIVQGPSDDNVRVVAALVALGPAPPSASAPPSAAPTRPLVPPSRPPVKGPPTKEPPKPPDTDIRLQR